MNPSSEHFRFYVCVEAKRGIKPKDVLAQLRIAFGDAAPSERFVYKWHKEFGSGKRQTVHHLPHSGRPPSKRTVSTVSRVFDFIESNPKSSVRCIADSLHLSKNTTHRILTEELFFRKVCSVCIVACQYCCLSVFTLSTHYWKIIFCIQCIRRSWKNVV
jgi:hypothetical protein